jgi:uncharacterized protein
MKFNLEDLGPVPKHLEFEVRADAEALKDVPAEFSGPIRAHIDICIEAGVIRTDGRLEAEMVRDCFRCLKQVEKQLSSSFTAGFITAETDKSFEEKEVAPEELDTSVLPDGQLDLIEVVREQMLLLLADSVLCVETCRGLCAHCGQNLNEAACKCGANEIDPRWKGLEDLKKDLQK